jgi:broad-specificity NMP kinase
MKIIAFCGDYGVGKTTAAKALEARVPNSVQVAFGDFLRADLTFKTGIDADVLYHKPTPTSVRNLLKGYGDLMREIHGPNHWVDKMKFFFTIPEEAEYAFIDDLRYVNELSELEKEYEVVLVYIGHKVDTYNNDILYDLADVHIYARPEVEDLIGAIFHELLLDIGL